MRRTRERRQQRRAALGCEPTSSSPTGRVNIIMDDIHLHSHSTAKKDGAASQAELLERICGHMSTHHDGGLSVFIAHQVWTGIPPKVRKLASHIILYPQRIAKDSVGHIARGCTRSWQLVSCDLRAL